MIGRQFPRTLSKGIMDVHFSHLCGWDMPWKEAIKTAAGH